MPPNTSGGLAIPQDYPSEQEDLLPLATSCSPHN